MTDISESYERRRPLLALAAQLLEKQARDALDGIPHVDRIAFRSKGAKSFLDKAEENGYKHPLVEIEDQVAGRVLVFFIEDIDVVVSALRKCFNEAESQRKAPKDESAFGYESHHLVCMIPPHCIPRGWDAQPDMPKTFELQVRTLFMHAWAEPSHNIGYKSETDLPRHIQRELAWAASSAWGADQALQRILNWHRERSKKESAGG